MQVLRILKMGAWSSGCQARARTVQGGRPDSALRGARGGADPRSWSSSAGRTSPRQVPALSGLRGRAAAAPDRQLYKLRDRYWANRTSRIVW